MIILPLCYPELDFKIFTFSDIPTTPAPTTPVPCDDYKDLCKYEKTMFSMECFGDCDNGKDLFAPIDSADSAWEECYGKISITSRYGKNEDVYKF